MIIPDICRVIHLLTPVEHMGCNRSIGGISPRDKLATCMNQSHHQGWGEVIPVGNNHSSGNIAITDPIDAILDYSTLDLKSLKPGKSFFDGIVLNPNSEFTL